MIIFENLLDALTLQTGYNSVLVTIGATCLGMASGGVGTFIFLRKRALVSDAIAHATLPGIGLAFVMMVILGGDGRFLPGLLIGSAISAWLGMLAVEWMSRKTLLSEDASIGAVLSVFFGFGIVLLTIIQSIPSARQAGLESFLLGATSSMIYSEALIIAISAVVSAFIVFKFRRQMTLVSFDPEYAQTSGINIKQTDLIMMSMVLVITVIGLKIVGLILIVAMLIIPSVTARFWTNRTERLLFLSSIFGGLSGYFGSAISASADNLPTGPIIVLIAFLFFILSLIFSPLRGVLSSAYRYWKFQRRVHLRQGLLAIAHRERIYDRMTLSVLNRAGYIRPDGVATEEGLGAAAKALRDEVRWKLARRIYAEDAMSSLYDGLTPIENILTSDEIAEIDRQISEPVEVQI